MTKFAFQATLFFRILQRRSPIWQQQKKEACKETKEDITILCPSTSQTQAGDRATQRQRLAWFARF